MLRLSDRFWKPLIFSTVLGKSPVDKFPPYLKPSTLRSSRKDSSSSETPESDSVREMEEQEVEYGLGWVRVSKSAVVKDSDLSLGLTAILSVWSPFSERKFRPQRRVFLNKEGWAETGVGNIFQNLNQIFCATSLKSSRTPIFSVSHSICFRRVKSATISGVESITVARCRLFGILFVLALLSLLLREECPGFMRLSAVCPVIALRCPVTSCHWSSASTAITFPAEPLSIYPWCSIRCGQLAVLSLLIFFHETCNRARYWDTTMNYNYQIGILTNHKRYNLARKS